MNINDYEKNHTLFIQPIFSMSKRIEGFECLLRTFSGSNDEAVRYASAEQTVLLAEREGKICELDLWVLQKAIELTKNKALPGVFITINISSLTLACEHTVNQIINIIRNNDVDAKKLILEITETAQGHIPFIVKNASKLKKHNISIVLDDYGSGYNMLGMLTNVEVLFIKLSKSILDSLGVQKANVVIEKTIQLMHSMDIKVVLEGVEKPFHLDLASRFNIDFLQGYHLGRPMLPAHYIKIIASDNVRPINFTALLTRSSNIR